MGYKIDFNREKFITSLDQEISFDSDAYDFHDYLNEKIEDYAKKGFSYVDPREDFYKPIDKRPFILTPSRTRLDMLKITRRLRKLELFNPHQIEAIFAWEVLMLNDIYYNGV